MVVCGSDTFFTNYLKKLLNFFFFTIYEITYNIFFSSLFKKFIKSFLSRNERRRSKSLAVGKKKDMLK
jgi:hypothetical protein